MSVAEDTAQDSQDRCMQSRIKSMWREDSREVHEWTSSLTKKSHTWNNSCKDTVKLAEMAANDEKQEDAERQNISKFLKQMRKERKEDEVRALLQEMKKIWRPRSEPLQRNRRCGPTTVGEHSSSRTKFGRCCRATKSLQF